MKHDNIIEVRNLHKYYDGIHILKGVSFDVAQGEFVSILGRSGCGKTTLLRCLNCLEILDSGSLKIDGITIERRNRSSAALKSGEKSGFRRFLYKEELPFNPKESQEPVGAEFLALVHQLRTRVGVLFQNLNLFPHLNVLDNVAKPLEIVKQLPKTAAREKAVELLEKVEMETFLDRKPFQISGGQAQRVAIARALAMEPKVMLYDEPTSALDPELIEGILSVMGKLHCEGMTQIVVTHAIQIAKKASDNVIFLEEGRIIEQGPPSLLFTNPKDQRTKNYLNILED